MNPILDRTIRIVLIAVPLACSANAFAGLEMLAIDAQFRARIVKEKIRTAAQERKNEQQEKALGQSDNQAANQGGCGSQSIGNIDTGGRIGAGPRDVVVFAPNAINIADSGSCH